MPDYIVLRAPPSSTTSMGAAASAGARERGEFSVGVESLDHAAQLGELRRDPETRSVARSMPVRLVEPWARKLNTEAGAGATWGVEAVGADASPYDGSGVVVAVLDTGIDAGHPAFAGVELVQRDFSGEGEDDEDGHGTHCAGTIFGREVEGKRIGVAPGVTRALVAKVLGSEGGTSLQIAQAIQWSLDEGANVISMSLGIDFPGLVDELVEEGMPLALATSMALEEYQANTELFADLASFSVSRARFAQVALLVAASGNESMHELNPNYVISVAPPAAARGFIAVGGLERSKQRLRVADFSNTKVAVSAPGVGVTSAQAGGGLVGMSGTSMATPHVAGVAALWYQKLNAPPRRVGYRELEARLIASGSVAKLVEPFEPRDVGTGCVQAPPKEE